MQDLANFAIEASLKAGAQFCDVRIENSQVTMIEIDNKVTKTANSIRKKGAGVRAFVDGAWAFAHTATLTKKALQEIGSQASRLAKAVVPHVPKKSDLDGPSYEGRVTSDAKPSVLDISFEEKLSLAQRVDESARSYDDRIVNARSYYRDQLTKLYVANSLGTNVWNEIGQIVMYSTAVAKEQDNRQEAIKVKGFTAGFEKPIIDQFLELGQESAEIAIDLLSSTAVKGDTYNVILNPDLTGLLIHEAFGHACEADNLLSHTTILEDRIGASLGPEYLSISDDPTIPKAFGSFAYDWEGTKAKKRFLVKNGVLSEFLHNLETASTTNAEGNGAARAQDFMYPPVCRMSNTIIEPSDWKYDEMLADTREGLMLCDSVYGYCSPSDGMFTFRTHHGYRIENGERAGMVRGPSLAGQILDILKKIDAVGNELILCPGGCGKWWQYAAVTMGGPYVRVDNMPVGGI
ncbi:MAG: TldD/PmbA family protein [Candidatus Hodarchaeales archaeon]|jgi:TldD protein